MYSTVTASSRGVSLNPKRCVFVQYSSSAAVGLGDQKIDEELRVAFSHLLTQMNHIGFFPDFLLDIIASASYGPALLQHERIIYRKRAALSQAKTKP